MANQMEAQFAGSETVLTEPNTVAFVQGKELGPGLLSIDESSLSWVSDDQSQQFSLEYPSISIHAISRDTSTFPHPCVYLMHCPQDGEEDEMEEGEKEAGEGGDLGVGPEREDDLGVGPEREDITEIRLVPQDPNHLDGIFQAITECQALYPDTEQLSSGEEGDEGEDEGEEGETELSGGEFFTSLEGVEHLTPEGQAVLEHLERVFQMPSPEEFQHMVTNGVSSQPGNDEGQFEDAD